ncbi:hypothetical protein TSAR_014791 [Trichomalopsis sarcophagae]|uniref:Uncharacterized protein n=1 Tax=Trichomalopsis sarcophagae TaxID=543379 RepID=A0A232ELW8_9HYME|nr:hypothetical protein TSAR_014791 [Trichomalopsis sarcophagae]
MQKKILMLHNSTVLLGEHKCSTVSSA